MCNISCLGWWRSRLVGEVLLLSVPSRYIWPVQHPPHSTPTLPALSPPPPHPSPLAPPHPSPPPPRQPHPPGNTPAPRDVASQPLPLEPVSRRGQSPGMPEDVIPYFSDYILWVFSFVNFMNLESFAKFIHGQHASVKTAIHKN